MKQARLQPPQIHEFHFHPRIQDFCKNLLIFLSNLIILKILSTNISNQIFSWLECQWYDLI